MLKKLDSAQIAWKNSLKNKRIKEKDMLLFLLNVIFIVILVE